MTQPIIASTSTTSSIEEARRYLGDILDILNSKVRPSPADLAAITDRAKLAMGALVLVPNESETLGKLKEIIERNEYGAEACDVARAYSEIKEALGL